MMLAALGKALLKGKAKKIAKDKLLNRKKKKTIYKPTIPSRLCLNNLQFFLIASLLKDFAISFSLIFSIFNPEIEFLFLDLSMHRKYQL